MDVVFGLIGCGLIIWAIFACCLARRARPAVRAPRTIVPSRPVPHQSAPAPAWPDDVATTITGWMLGHEIAGGSEGFPGDPLPGGHLGSASDLAFWGSVFDDDPDDPDF